MCCLDLLSRPHPRNKQHFVTLNFRSILMLGLHQLFTTKFPSWANGELHHSQSVVIMKTCHYTSFKQRSLTEIKLLLKLTQHSPTRYLEIHLYVFMKMIWSVNSVICKSFMGIFSILAFRLQNTSLWLAVQTPCGVES